MISSDNTGPSSSTGAAAMTAGSAGAGSPEILSAGASAGSGGGVVGRASAAHRPAHATSRRRYQRLEPWRRDDFDLPAPIIGDVRSRPPFSHDALVTDSENSSSSCDRRLSTIEQTVKKSVTPMMMPTVTVMSRLR